MLGQNVLHIFSGCDATLWNMTISIYRDNNQVGKERPSTDNAVILFDYGCGPCVPNTGIHACGSCASMATSGYLLPFQNHECNGLSYRT